MTQSPPHPHPHWEERLALDNEPIDGEHRLQIDLVNALEDALEKGRAREESEDILRQLDDFTNMHFMSEELMMRFHSYPETHAHADEHRELLEHLRTLRQRFGRDDVPLTLETIRSLRRWLGAHIRTMDRKLAHHINQGKMGPDPR